MMNSTMNLKGVEQHFQLKTGRKYRTVLNYTFTL